MKGYALYLRKSRADDPGESIAQTLKTHRETLEKLAKQSGLTVTREYMEVVSGERLSGRPEMQKLLAAVEQGEFSGVLCMDIDRLGRGGMQDQGLILDTFRHSGTRILTPERAYDLRDECDEELTEFKAFFARREYKLIRKRLQRGITAAVEDGAYVSNAPFGYRRCRQGRRSTLEIVPQEAVFVRLAYARYLEGVGPAAIARELNEKGAVTRRKAPWSRNTVRYLLTNPVYCGGILYRRNTPDRLWAKGLHPPILSRELWQQAQQRRAALDRRQKQP